jgi:hypothetical protein
MKKSAVKDKIFVFPQGSSIIRWNAQPVIDYPVKLGSAMATLFRQLPGRIALDDPPLKPNPFF